MKKNWKRMVCVLLCLGLCICGGCGQKAAEPTAEALTWQEQYDLGVRYLSEGKYAEAILAFTAAIDIDPKQAEAYIGLADVYTCQGEHDKALDILKQGLEATGGSSAITDKIAELEGGNIADPSGKTHDDGGRLAYWLEYTYNAERQINSATAYNAEGIQTGHVDVIPNEQHDPLYFFSPDTGELSPIEYEYDDHGNTIKVTNYSADGSLRSYTLCQYDDAGNCIRENYYDSNNVLNSYYSLDEYNGKGKRVKASRYWSDGTLESKDIFRYDENGNQIEYGRYNADGTLESKYISRYNENGNLIEEGSYDADGTLNYKFTHRYDENGNQIECSHYDADGTLESKDICHYDENGNCIRVDSYVYDVYDSSGNLTRSTVEE